MLVNWPSFVWPGSRGASKGWKPPPGYSPPLQRDPVVRTLRIRGARVGEGGVKTRNCDIMSHENQLPSSIISALSSSQRGWSGEYIIGNAQGGDVISRKCCGIGNVIISKYYQYYILINYIYINNSNNVIYKRIKEIRDYISKKNYIKLFIKKMILSRIILSVQYLLERQRYLLFFNKSFYLLSDYSKMNLIIYLFCMHIFISPLILKYHYTWL